MILTEADLQFDFTSAVSARKFDDETHGLSHCMKAVDFVVELPDRILFIEVKDPNHPCAQQKNVKNFIESLKSDALINESLVPKCRDSYLYELSMGNINKPVYYYVLIAWDKLTDGLTDLTNTLTKQIPVEGPRENNWPNRFIEKCAIMNIETWNLFLTDFPVSRTNS